jgi:hypothetical protein
MPELTVEQAQELIEGLKKRVADIDNQVRVHDSAITDIQPALEDMSHSLEILNVAMQNLFFTQSQDQILIETVVRYLAGYKKGDFESEMKTVNEQIEAGKEPEGFTVRSKNDFDAALFYDLAQEIGTQFAETRKKKMAQAKAKYAEEEAKKVRKPTIQIVKNLPKEL